MLYGRRPMSTYRHRRPGALHYSGRHGALSSTPARRPGSRRFRRRLTIGLTAAVAVALTVGVTYASARPSRPTSAGSPLLKAGEVSVWGATTVPRTTADPDTDAVEVGTRFRTAVPGTVSAILFYKDAKNTGTHRGALWDRSGKRLASVQFTGETASGWQSARLGSPVRLTANVDYVVSYNAPNGRYADDVGYFGSGRERRVGPLTATAGLYAYGGTSRLPTLTWMNSTYYVDVAFRPDAGAPPAPAPSTPGAPSMSPVSPTAMPTAAPSTASSAPTTPTSSPTRPPASSAPSGGTGCAGSPSSCGYPDGSNTGIPAGVALKASRSVTADKAGQVIDGLDITGEINVTAPNVTIRNTRVTGGGDWVVVVRDGADNLTIEDSELQTPAGSPQDIACLLNIGDSKPTIRRANIHGCSAGISSGGGLVQDSYIHDMAQIPGLSHDVGVASNGGGGMTITHNTIFNQYDQTAAVAFYQDFGTQQNNLVQNNLLAGGGYCVYGGTGTKGATANIRFINNRFSQKYHPNCGYFGVVASFNRNDPGNAWTGNYWDHNLQPVN
jgi:hypothetical protein